MDDSFITLELEIGHHIVAYYERLFAKDDRLSQDFSILNNFSWPAITDDQNLLLTATPSLEEICDAVFGLDASSSPGPDGFGGVFYQICWDIILDDARMPLFTFSLLLISPMV